MKNLFNKLVLKYLISKAFRAEERADKFTFTPFYLSFKDEAQKTWDKAHKFAKSKELI